MDFIITWIYYNHAVPFPWVRNGLDIWYLGEQDAPTKTAPRLLMTYWSFYLGVLEASMRYGINELSDTCWKALLEIDIFSHPHALSTRHPSGRTMVGFMLHELYMWTARCVEHGLIRFDEGPLTEILRMQVPKMVDLLKRTDDGVSQLRKDILHLYRMSDARADEVGGSFWRFREDHRHALEETKKLDYEEVVQDQDGIWTLQIKPDALEVASKL